MIVFSRCIFFVPMPVNLTVVDLSDASDVVI